MTRAESKVNALFVANGGGHLKELLHLSERLPFDVGDSLWVTFDSPQSRSLLAGKDVAYVHYSSPRDGRATALNLLAAARILSKRRFDVAISTGATVAVSFLPLARLHGATCYYIESATRTDGPSLTGRILERVPGIRLFTQDPRWAGGRWAYAGSVFDQFESRSEEPASFDKAVVTVGASETYGFNRLFETLVGQFPSHTEVLWQTGCSDVGHLGIDAHRQIPARELDAAMKSADVVVAHAGVGSALSALESGRMPILVPREQAHGEHVDDHQFAIAEELAARHLAVYRRVEDLGEKDLDEARSHRIVELEHPETLRLTEPSPPSKKTAGRSRTRQGLRSAKGPGLPVFIAWGAIAGRSAELAEALGADVLSCFPPGEGHRPPAVMRYMISTLRTVAYLLRNRPAAVIVTNPPIIPVLLAVAYGRIAGRPVVFDDHPGAFGAQGYRIGEIMLPLHRRLVPMARLCLVTDESWVDLIEQWGGRGLILHEAPGDWTPAPERHPNGSAVVLFVCTFAPDEPIEAVFEAASLTPEVEYHITGDLDRAPTATPPANVRLTGFLDRDSYRQAVEDADVLLALTTEPTSAMRAAFEAVWAEKVLILNDWPLLRELFPNAVHVDNSGSSIAAGVRESLDQHARLRKGSAEARQVQLDRWDDQLSALREALTAPARIKRS
jgi:UDP-N-acetylglucosamine--N-acetylmuramyl-(pentapeptide) pyrophosphoryl-undecaprenol N-acetylglucosamine transferase